MFAKNSHAGGKLRLLACVIFSAALAPAQTSTGQISGTVLDSTGAVIPGATVRIIGQATGEQARVIQSSEAGRFSAPLLRPGIYRIEVESLGFKTHVRSDVALRVDDSIELSLTLEPGVVSEQITVRAAAVQLEETTHSVGQVVEEATIQQLPLNGRNYLDLGNLSAGTTPNTRTRDNTFSAYGNRGNQNAFLLDGARNVNYLRGLDNRQRDAMRPSLEAVSEFKVQTSNFSAEYGASAGAVVNVVTKSGTNQVHGSAFEFLRNDNLDARDFFAQPDAPRPLFIQNQFGGSLGGPIIKDRAWIHGAYQRTDIREGTTQTATVPSVAEKAGRFTRPVFNPFSTRANPDGDGFVRDAFPNNEIPATMFDPVGKNVVDRFPDPLFSTAARNFVRNPSQSTTADNFTARGDVRLSDADSMFGRFSFNLPDFTAQAALPPPAATPVVRTGDAWSFGYGYTRVFSPTVVNEFRAAWNKIEVDQDGTLAKDEIVPGSLAPGVESSIPVFSLTGFTSIGSQPSGFGNIPLLKDSRVLNLSDNVSIVRGKHTLKFGFDYQRIQSDTEATLSGRGSFSFTGVFSQDPRQRPGTGSPVADLLLGLPNNVSTGTRAMVQEEADNFYWFMQDDWQISSRLTLNLGLRYQLTQPFVEKNNRMSALILQRESPLFGEFLIAGDPRRPRSLLDKDKNNFAPRFGFAYRAGRGFVVRGGYGIFYGQDEGSGVNRRLTNNPPFFGFGGVNLPSDQLLPSSTLKLSDGLPPRPDPIDPQDFVLDPRATAALNSWPLRFTLPLIQQWTLSVQKELPGGMLWEAAYVGNKGDDLWSEFELNQPRPGPGSPADRRPFGDLSRAPIFEVSPWVASTYHGVSTRLEKRFSQGLSFLAAYTLGRSLDTASSLSNCDGCTDAVQDSRNLGAQKGPSVHNIPQRFTFSGIWELPFGSDRKYGAASPLRHVFGGWAVTGIVTFSDGIPFTPTLNFDNANTGSSSRPDRLRDGRLDNPTVDRFFDVDAFVAPAPFTFGNSGRNILEGPGTSMVNFGLNRNFPLPFNETSRLEFRFEAFNLLNRTHFGLPGSAIGAPTAGVIGSTAQSNRQLQFSLKVLF